MCQNRSHHTLQSSAAVVYWTPTGTRLEVEDCMSSASGAYLWSSGMPTPAWKKSRSRNSFSFHFTHKLRIRFWRRPCICEYNSDRSTSTPCRGNLKTSQVASVHSSMCCAWLCGTSSIQAFSPVRSAICGVGISRAECSGALRQCSQLTTAAVQKPCASHFGHLRGLSSGLRQLLLHRHALSPHLAAARRQFSSSWHASARAAAADLSAQQQRQIDEFLAFLLEENEKYNLTGKQILLQRYC